MTTTATPIDLIESRLAAAGCDPRRRGDKLTSKCPAHDDSSPSLSVAPGRKRDVVLTCFAGCAPDAVLAALDMKWTDFSANGTNGPMREVATYDYVSLHGELLYQVVRYAPKTFRQRRPDGRGGWIWGLGDVPRTLYRLPEVVAAARTGGDVFVVEGEKDADALRATGVVATCNSGGAGKFTMEMADHLEHAHVTIVADDDEPGRSHAAEVAWMARSAGAASVRIMGPAVGKDVSDHLAAGLGVADLVPVAIEEAKPPEHPLARFTIDWGSFWSAEGKGADWLLEPLFARGRGHAIYAGAKTGKSYLVLAACAALATGKPFLGHPGGEPVDVLYVDYEMTEDDLRDRLEDFGYGPDSDLSRLHYVLLPSIEGLDTEEGGSALVESARAVAAELVVIDTTGRAVEGEENSADTLRAFYRHTGLPLKQAEIAFVRLDHAGKDATKGQRGSSAKNDDVDVVIRMSNIDGGKRLEATHRRMSWFPERTDIGVVDEVGVVRFTSGAPTWPAGTAELAAAFDSWKVPPGTGWKAIRAEWRDALEAHGEAHGVRVTQRLLQAAVRFWKQSHELDWVEK